MMKDWLWFMNRVDELLNFAFKLVLALLLWVFIMTTKAMPYYVSKNLHTILKVVRVVSVVVVLALSANLLYRHYTKPSKGDNVTIEYAQRDGTIKNVSGMARVFEGSTGKGKPFNIVVCDTVQNVDCVVINSFNGDVILSIEKETK